jgi:hypothetical protein
MQTAGLSDRELVALLGVVDGVDSVVNFVVVVAPPFFSHDSISEPYISDHLRFSSADSKALLAASVAAPRSLSSTKSLNCQEQKSKQNNYNEMLSSVNAHIVI